LIAPDFFGMGFPPRNSDFNEAVRRIDAPGLLVEECIGSAWKRFVMAWYGTCSIRKTRPSSNFSQRFETFT
jgi:hypothetical protein